MTFLKCITSTKYDVIHFHSSFAGAMGRIICALSKNRSRVFYTPHGYAFLKTDIPAVLRNFFWFAEKTLGSKQVAMIACSQGEADLGSKFNYGSVNIVPNAINLDQMDKIYSPRVASVQKKFSVCICGRITSARSPNLFRAVAIDVMNQSPNILFTWIGGGSLADEKELRDAGITVTGWLERDRALSLLSHMDLYIQTSLWEGMPYAVIEAQYYGLPAIVTDIVGNRDIIDDFVSGFLVNTTKEFSEKIILLHDDDALYSNLSKNAKENIKRKHNVKNQSASIREVYMSKL